MFKNKKSVYLLIPLNLFIWGFFIYRFYTAYHEADMPEAQHGVQKMMPSLSPEDSLPYRLSLDYKDPFLKEEQIQRSSSQISRSSVTQSKPVVTQVTVQPTLAAKQLPDIKYVGMIKNNSSGLRMALVSLNGESHLVKASDVVGGITVKSFSADSLVARWGKEKIILRR